MKLFIKLQVVNQMDDIFSLIFFLWIAYAFIAGANNKKKLPAPKTESDQYQQNEEPSTFEIPTLANDPNLSTDNLPSAEVVKVENLNSIEDIFRQRQEFLRRQNMITSESSDSPSNDDPPKSNESEAQFKLNFDKSNALNAIVLAEIFNKPKALRKR